jgi:hypothetical protein
MPKPENNGKPDNAGGPDNKRKVNLSPELWAALQAQAEAEGVEPKELAKRLLSQALGVSDQSDDDDAVV